MTDTTLSSAARPVLRRTTESSREIQTELDAYKALLREFREMPLDEVLLSISSIHARLVTIRALLIRSDDRVASSLRTKEVDPLMDACDFQFKIFSRLQSIREMEWHQAR